MIGVVEVVAILAVFLAFFLYQKRAKPLKGIRLASGYKSYFGHAPVMKEMFSGPHQKIFDWSLDNALEGDATPYQISIPDRDSFIRVVTPEAVKFMLKDEFDKFIKMNNLISKLVIKEFIGSGIFASDGEAWRFERKVASYMFSSHVLDEVMCPIFLQHGETVLGMLKARHEKKESFDMQDLLKRFTMDSICQVAFGVHFDSLSKPDCEFSKAFDRIQELITQRNFKPEFLFYLHRWLKIGGEKEIEHDGLVLSQSVHRIIEQRNQKLEKGGQENSRWNDLLSQFILMKKKRGEKLDPEQTRDIVMNFLIAGRDTTACLLVRTFYELSRHPEMEQKILKEMSQVFSDAPVGAEGAKELKYTHNFLSEVLRLHPPVPFDTKKAAEDITFPDGTWVPKDTICQYSPYIYGRLPWIWGEDAQEFKPERWEKDPNPSEFKFITFNYKIVVEPNQSFEPVAGIIYWFREGLQVRAEPRC